MMFYTFNINNGYFIRDTKISYEDCIGDMKNSLKIKRSGEFIGDVKILSWRYGEFIWRH
jgi:hypothetical protein